MTEKIYKRTSYNSMMLNEAKLSTKLAIIHNDGQMSLLGNSDDYEKEMYEYLNELLETGDSITKIKIVELE